MAPMTWCSILRVIQQMVALGGGGLDQCAGIFSGALGAQAPAVITGTSAAATGASALAEADAQFSAGTEWYAVDNNATLATCDWIYLPESDATGAYAAQFTYTVGDWCH